MGSSKITKKQIKVRIAPCGLHCGKCFAFKEGDIGLHSQQLKYFLGDFKIYAERFVDLLDEKIFEKYSDFKEMLDYLALPQCGGCRIDTCKLFKCCKVRDCAKSKGVDFCFECLDFPCENTGFDKHLHDRSITINKRIKEIGIEQYYQEIKDIPRY